jgi:predicted phage tail protein
MLRTIQLHGALANRFSPDPIQLDVNDIPMLFSGLSCAYPEFMTELRQHEQLALIAKRGDELRAITDNELAFPLPDHPELHLYVPVQGSVVTEAWVAGAFFTAAAAGTAYVTIATILINLAIAVAVGALARAFAPKPETGGDGSGVEERRSGLFDQAVNLEGQGHGRPVLYGRFKVGSIVISAEVTTEKNAIAIGDYTKLTSPATVTGNVLTNDVDGGTITITTFSIAGVSYSAGDTYSIVGFSVTLNVDGSFIIIAGADFSGNIDVTYYGTSPTTPSTSTTWKIQVQTVQEQYPSTGEGA